MGGFSRRIVQPALPCKLPPCREARRWRSRRSPTIDIVPEIVPISIAFVVGGLLGWLGCWLSRKNRPSQPDARLEEELRQQLRQREQELESGRARITQTSAALAAAEANRDAAQRMLDEAR